MIISNWFMTTVSGQYKYVSFLFFQDKFFLLELKNGILRLMYDFGFSNGPKLLENNLAKLQINDAKYHEVAFCVFIKTLK